MRAAIHRRASIVAKVYRDACMRVWTKYFPPTACSHKGYATPEHCLALQRFGTHLASSQLRAGARVFAISLALHPQMDLFETAGAHDAHRTPAEGCLCAAGAEPAARPCRRRVLSLYHKAGGVVHHILSGHRAILLISRGPTPGITSRLSRAPGVHIWTTCTCAAHQRPGGGEPVHLSRRSVPPARFSSTSRCYDCEAGWPGTGRADSMNTFRFS